MFFQGQYFFYKQSSNWFYEDASYIKQIEIWLWTFWKEEKNIPFSSTILFLKYPKLFYYFVFNTLKKDSRGFC